MQKLLKEIKGISYKFDVQKYPPMAMVEAVTQLHHFFQGTNMTNTQYYDKFNSLVHLCFIVARQNFHSLMKHLGLVEGFVALSRVNGLHLIDNWHKLQLNEINGLFS